MKRFPFQNIMGIVIFMASMIYFFWISWSDRATSNPHIGEIKIALIANLGIVIGYFFGSSQGEKKKSEVVDNLIAPKDGSTVITTKSPDPDVMKANEEIKQNDLNNNNKSL